MDPVTHAVCGSVLGRGFFKDRLGRWSLLAGLLAGLWPDVDIFLRPLGLEFYLRHHRGATNSLILLIPSALISALILKAIFKKAGLRDLVLLTFVSICVHTFMDLITSFGTMIFWPLSLARPALDLVFIIDPLLTGIFALALVVMLVARRGERPVAVVAFALFAAYLGLCWSQKAAADRLALAYTQKLDVATRVHTLPQPFSPKRWALMVEGDEAVYRGLVDLGKDGPATGNPGGIWERLESRYDPPDTVNFTKWTRFDPGPTLARDPRVDFYLWFARFPVVFQMDKNRIEVMDLRFFIGEGFREPPFRLVVELDGDGRVKSSGLVR